MVESRDLKLRRRRGTEKDESEKDLPVRTATSPRGIAFLKIFKERFPRIGLRLKTRNMPLPLMLHHTRAFLRASVSPWLAVFLCASVVHSQNDKGARDGLGQPA